MPNITTNRLVLKKKDIKVLDFIKNENGEVDFNLLVPMPKHQEGIFYADGNLGKQEQFIYGKNNWYDWSCDNWGTKWNAFDSTINIRDRIIEVIFDTAWDMPRPWFAALCKKFPQVNIKIDSTYEGGYEDTRFINNNGIMEEI